MASPRPILPDRIAFVRSPMASTKPIISRSPKLLVYSKNVTAPCTVGRDTFRAFTTSGSSSAVPGASTMLADSLDLSFRRLLVCFVILLDHTEAVLTARKKRRSKRIGDHVTVIRERAEARMAIFEFIEGWYNPARRHSARGHLSPTSYERNCTEQLKSDSH